MQSDGSSFLQRERVPLHRLGCTAAAGGPERRRAAALQHGSPRLFSSVFSRLRDGLGWVDVLLFK